MNYSLYSASCLMALIVSGSWCGADEPPASKDTQAAIRASADAFVAAFQKRDASAIAAWWTPDGVYINEEGERFEGRPAIQAEYEFLFQNSPENLRVKLEIDFIRTLNETTVVEEGRAALVPQPVGATRVMSRYTAVHVQQDDAWLIAHLRDTREELPPDTGDLQNLDWLVGTWTASREDVSVKVTYRWIENQHFLARSHVVTESSTTTSGGLDIIGIDPTTRYITSWSFSHDGSHAMGVWCPQKNGWIIEAEGMMSDGTETGATHQFSRGDGDTLVWKSVNRSLDDTSLPDTEEVVLKRE